MMCHQFIHTIHLFRRYTLALQSGCVRTSYELGVSIHPKFGPDKQMHRGTYKHWHMYKTNTLKEIFWFLLGSYGP